MIRQRSTYDQWKRLLLKLDEETTNTAVKPLGSLQHPSEASIQAVIYPEEDERASD